MSSETHVAVCDKVKGGSRARTKRVMRSPKTRYRHMTPEKAREIRTRYFRREAKQTELAREYGLAQSTVSRIVSGYVWDR